MKLLKDLIKVHAPSGEEYRMKEFILNYIKKNEKFWAVKPTVYEGRELMDCIVLSFGKPRTAVFAHMDTIGFTVRYHDQLVPIGGPDAESGYKLTGSDTLGLIDCELVVDEHHNMRYKFGRGIERGTSLVFKSDFRETEKFVQSPYLDNRLGVYNALRLAETLQDGLIIFSCWEEHGGGSVPFLARFMYEKYGVNQALISDITWVTEGVNPGDGVVISLRDKLIPRRSYLDRIIKLASESQIQYQLEVEGSGSSDGRELQMSPYPIDWCFIGAPEDNVHSPDEIVHKDDIENMLLLYQVLMGKL